MVVYYGPGEWIEGRFPGVPIEYEDHDYYPEVIQLESGDGYKLTGEDNGLVMTPKGTDGLTSDAFDAGDELSAAWYQPFTNEYYLIFIYIQNAYKFRVREGLKKKKNIHFPAGESVPTQFTTFY